MARRTAANRGRHSVVAVCNSPSRMASNGHVVQPHWRSGGWARVRASRPRGRVAEPDPPDRGAASIRAKDRSGAAASDDGAGAAPLGAWQVAQQLSGVRPGGQVGLGDHAGRTEHCISPQLPWPRRHAERDEIINPRRWILIGQEELRISCERPSARRGVCPASRARPDQVVTHAPNRCNSRG